MLRPSRLLYLRLSQQDKFAFHSVIDAASHQKDLVLSKLLWTDDRVSLYGMMTASHPVIDAASHQKDLVLSKLLWTDDRVSLYGSMPRQHLHKCIRKVASLYEVRVRPSGPNIASALWKIGHVSIAKGRTLQKSRL